MQKTVLRSPKPLVMILTYSKRRIRDGIGIKVERTAGARDVDRVDVCGGVYSRKPDLG